MAIKMEERKASKGSEEDCNVDKDLVAFHLPDVDNWTGYMDKAWDESILQIRGYSHRNIEKHSDHWEKLRTAELEARKTKKQQPSGYESQTLLDLEKSSSYNTLNTLSTESSSSKSPNKFSIYENNNMGDNACKNYIDVLIVF